MKKEDVYNDIINMYENERIHKFRFMGTKEAINKLNDNYCKLFAFKNGLTMPFVRYNIWVKYGFYSKLKEE